MNRLYFMEIDTLIDDSVLQEMAAVLSNEKKERLSRYRRDSDRKIGIFSEVLARCLISKHFGIDYRAIDIKASPAGKPYITCLPRCEFNISHTRYAVAAALSEQPVGVDVEKIRDIDLNVARRAFSDQELAWLNDEPGDRNRRFFEIWTKKEALSKYYGTGLINSLKSYDVTDSFRNERFTSFVTGDYVLSVCSRLDVQINDYIQISEPEFIEMWRKLAK